MNYTPNHHLPQWVESDPIRMKDFNDAMASIESGLNAAGDSATAQAALDKAETAQATANAAKSAASAAQIAADEAKAAAASAKSYVIGSYVGRTYTQSIYVGFTPSFLMISGEVAADGNFTGGQYSAAVGGDVLTARCRPIDQGFNVFTADATHPEFPNLNDPGRTYTYIAFK